LPPPTHRGPPSRCNGRSGCRRTSLHHEIANATRVLGAAGIDARLQVNPAAKTDRLSETSRNLLGLMMREATINVLRHS
jgi:two-component system sensor histidine kinase DesK